MGSVEIPALYIVTLLTLILGSIVYYKDSKSRSNQLFFLLSLSFVVWAIVNYFSVHQPGFGDKLLWIRLVLFAAAPQAILFALFINTFPKDHISLGKREVFLFLALLASQCTLTLTPLVFQRVVLENGKYVPVAGPGIPFYAAGLIFSFGIGIYWLIKKIFNSKGEEKKGLMIILYGFAMMVVLVLSFLLFAVSIFKNTSFVPFSPLFITPFIVCTAYALIRGGLLNFRLIATELFVIILSLTLFVEALLSGSWISIIWKSIFSIGIGFLGLLLSRSVYKEIERREELANLAKSLEKANLRLQELDRQKTDFLSFAAHQLRTPLSIMNGYLELLTDDGYGKIPTEAKKIMKNMDESNGHLVTLVDTFLDITRLEQGRTKYDFKLTNLDEIIENVMNEFKQRAHKKGLELKWKQSVDLPPTYIDGEKIRHVVYNFVDNAIKYTEKGEIVVHSFIEKNGIVIKVKDDGLGFEKTDEASFFQKFYRGENVKGVNVNGTGLGLYVCRMFVEAHRGRVWAHSTGKGKGSEFGFWIPIMNTAPSLDTPTAIS